MELDPYPHEWDQKIIITPPLISSYKREDRVRGEGVGNSREKGEQRIIIWAVGRATQKGKIVEFV